MPASTDLHTEISGLPPNLRAEVLDFVQFVKQRHGLPAGVVPSVPQAESCDSPLFQALEAAGFVGCIETDEQLSTTYKGKIDFSSKSGGQS